MNTVICNMSRAWEGEHDGGGTYDIAKEAGWNKKTAMHTCPARVFNEWGEGVKAKGSWGLPEGR